MSEEKDTEIENLKQELSSSNNIIDSLLKSAGFKDIMGKFLFDYDIFDVTETIEQAMVDRDELKIEHTELRQENAKYREALKKIAIYGLCSSPEHLIECKDCEKARAFVCSKNNAKKALED